jgi:AcrR family transcriptional regulator
MSTLAVFERLAEERIREAMKLGEFENLPGRGKPLVLEDDRHLADDLRIAYKILKNADCLPEELQLRKDIARTEELLAGIQDTREKYRQLQKLNFLIMKLNMMRRVSPLLEEGQRYFEKVVERLEKGSARSAKAPAEGAEVSAGDRHRPAT